MGPRLREDMWGEEWEGKRRLAKVSYEGDCRVGLGGVALCFCGTVVDFAPDSL